MKIVTDHGFPKGTMPDDDAFDRFKNELDYCKQSSGLGTQAAAMSWAVTEIEHLRLAIKISLGLDDGTESDYEEAAALLRRHQQGPQTK